MLQQQREKSEAKNTKIPCFRLPSECHPTNRRCRQGLFNCSSSLFTRGGITKFCTKPIVSCETQKHHNNHTKALFIDNARCSILLLLLRYDHLLLLRRKSSGCHNEEAFSPLNSLDRPECPLRVLHLGLAINRNGIVLSEKYGSLQLSWNRPSGHSLWFFINNIVAVYFPKSVPFG